MSSILDIPQIEIIKESSLQNDLHIGFGGDVSKRIQKVRWTDASHATKAFPESEG